MKKITFLLFFSAVVLVGCGEKTPVQTVDWYKTHDAERLAMIEKCAANPGELAASPDDPECRRHRVAVLAGHEDGQQLSHERTSASTSAAHCARRGMRG